ncbi:MAG: VanZ family protein [Verrucomicrobiae bacterium]|nr:VanZ family protein [Verrucomicrobiae bacterium]
MKFSKYWLPVVIVAMAIWFASSLTGREVGDAVWWTRYLPDFLRVRADKLGHAMMFGALGALGLRALFFGHGWPLIRSGWGTLAGCALYGAVDEIHQLWAPGRSCDPMDWLADVIGSGLFIVAWGWFFARKRSGQQGEKCDSKK